MCHRYGLALASALLASWPLAASAADTIKIGFPIPLSGPVAIYGEPVLKGAQLAVSEINAKGGLLGKKVELVVRDSKANADEAVRVSRELIIKDGVNFLVGTVTSAEAPAVSTVAKENKIVFIAPVAETTSLTSPQNIHPYVFRTNSNTDVDGLASAILMARWKNVKTVATMAPDYAYGHDIVTAFIADLKKRRPDIQIVDQQWPKLGEPDFTSFITAQMSKKPDAVYCVLFAGDFVTFSKEAEPRGYFKMIDNRMVDSAAVGNVEEAQALGNDYPYGIVAQSVDPEIWIGAKEPPEHATYIAALRKFTHDQYPPSFSIQGYITINALADAIKKAGSTNSDAVSKALIGLTFDTPVGKRTINVKAHETFPPEFYGVMVKQAAYPFAVLKDPELLPKSFTPTN